jgi:hypothetical protein
VYGNIYEDDIDLFYEVSDPGEIPNFDNFKSPGIEPGDTGTLEFTITNRYFYNETKKEIRYTDYNMYNVSLIINIYRYTTLEESEKISDISNRPEIYGGSEGLRTIPDKQTAEFYWTTITAKETVNVLLKIRSKSNTPQGTYFVRMHINFKFNGTYFDMKSRGYFTNSQWDAAQPSTLDKNQTIVGRLNLEALNVSGLIPDTSIRIKEPIPIWPLYVFIGLAAIFLILALVFYLMDEKGKFPNAKRKLDDFGERINNFRYRRG